MLICVAVEPSGRVIVRYLVCPGSITVQPEGIPLTPVVQSLKPDALTNVPLEATPSNHLFVQYLAVIFVARQITFCNFEHPKNIYS